jgi:hypothetical protein
MPKFLTNNRVTYNTVAGRIIQHDLYLDQGVKTTDSPTFGNLTVSGNTTIKGNLYVEGNTSVLDTLVVEFQDNILLVNSRETGPGVTLHQAGIEIDRGSSENFRIVYNEDTSSFEAGLISSLAPVALRESNPLNGGLIVWNASTNRMESVNTVGLPINFASTENSTSSSTGSLRLGGGLGIKKDLFIDGKAYFTGSSNQQFSVIYTDPGNNSLTLQSGQDLLLNASQQVKISTGTPLVFSGGPSASNANLNLSANTGLLSLTNAGGLLLDSSSVTVPSGIPIVFSTVNEKIFTNGSNDLVVQGSQNVVLNPGNGGGNGKKILVPVDTPIAFGLGSAQFVVADTNNDLTIGAGNNILLNPGQNLDVRIPTDSGIKFGGNNNQRIVGDSSNNLLVYASNEIDLISRLVRLSANSDLEFGSSGNYIVGDTSGNLTLGSISGFVSSASDTRVTSITNSTSKSSGAFVVNGGIGIAHDAFFGSRIVIDSQDTSALSVGGALTVSTLDFGKVLIRAGDGTSVNPTLELINDTSLLNADTLLSLKSLFDDLNGYYIGRGKVTQNSGRNMTVTIPRLLDYGGTGSFPKFVVQSSDDTELLSVESGTGNLYSAGKLTIGSTDQAINPTTASFVIAGGLGVVKNLKTSGEISASVDSFTAFLVGSSDSSQQLLVDTVSKQVSVIGMDLSLSGQLSISGLLSVNNSSGIVSNTAITILDTRNASDTSSGSVILAGGLGMSKSLYVGGSSNFGATVDLTTHKIINLAEPTNPQDAATKMYVDLVKQGLFVKDSVTVASVSTLVITNLVAGYTVDGYTLVTDDRVLLKDQFTTSENGIYVVSASGGVRSLDLVSGSDARGIFVFVRLGSVNSSNGFICNNPNSAIIGTDGITFTQFTGLGQVVAGNGLSKNLNEIYVNVDSSSIEINADTLRISSGVAGTGLTGGSGTQLATSTDQSHVTKLGTINTGSWQGTSIGVAYGGTGRTSFPQGNIVFGNDTGALGGDNRLTFDTANSRLGVGTSFPTSELHLQSANTVTLLLDADADNNNSSAKPEMAFRYSGITRAYIGMTRNANEYATGIYSDSVVLQNNSGPIQLGTGSFSRVTVLGDGKVGINTSTPTNTLSVNGSVDLNGIVYLTNTRRSSNSSSASLLVSGGISISGTSDATSATSGGGLTVAGGGAFASNLYVGSGIYTTSLQTGTLKSTGILEITDTTDAVMANISGSFNTLGGVFVNKSLVVNGDSYLLGVSNLSGLRFSKSSDANYLESGTVGNSFKPLIFTGVGEAGNGTLGSLIYINDNGLNLVGSKSLQFGETFRVNYNSGFLTMTSSSVGDQVNLGSSLNGIGLGLYGNNNSSVNWTPTNDQLSFTGKYTLNFDSRIVLNNPGTSGNYLLNGIGSSPSSLYIGRDGTSELSTILSNADSSAQLSFIGTSGSAVLSASSAVTTIFSGTTKLLGSLTRFSGNGLKTVLYNSAGSPVWYFLGTVTSDLSLQAISGSTTTYFKFNESSFSYSNCGNSKVRFVVYSNSGILNLFIVVGASNKISLEVEYCSDLITPVGEGTGATPDGSSSGFGSGFVSVYDSNLISSDIPVNLGNTTINGTQFNVADGLPIIGYVNEKVTAGNFLGVLFQRYQKSNDTGLGDVITDNPNYTEVLADQSLAVNPSNVILGTGASTLNNAYLGWWFKLDSQIRRVIAYSGTQKALTLDSNLTTSATIGNTVNLYNRSYAVNSYDKVDDSFTLGYASTDSQESFGINSLGKLKLDQIKISSSTSSLSTTSGSALIVGGLGIQTSIDSTSSTSGGALTIAGGLALGKSICVGNSIWVSDNSGLGSDGDSADIVIKKLNPSLAIINTSAGSSKFEMKGAGVPGFGLIYNPGELSIFGSGGSKVLTVGTSGNIGIGSSSVSDNLTLLTLVSNSIVSTNSSSGYLGLIAGRSASINSSVASSLLLWSNGDTSGNSGKVILAGGNSANSSGSISLVTGDISRLEISQAGIVNLSCTQDSQNSSIGTLVVSGGVSVSSSRNSTSFTSGGALTVAGGASIYKDLYLGGSLYINGTLNATGSVQTPTLTFQNYINCGTGSAYNPRIVQIGNSITLTFSLSIYPSVGSSNCQVEFNLPSRSNVLAERGDVICNCSGYSDETNLDVLFNVLAVGISNTTRALIKFQSISSAVHQLQINCSYLAN